LSFRQQFRAIILKTFFLKKIVLSLKAFWQDQKTISSKSRACLVRDVEDIVPYGNSLAHREREGWGKKDDASLCSTRDVKDTVPYVWTKRAEHTNNRAKFTTHDRVMFTTYDLYMFTITYFDENRIVLL